MFADRRPAAVKRAPFTQRSSVAPWRFIALICICVTGVAAAGCGDDDKDPAIQCEELCGQNKCPRDITAAQCNSRCLEWHDVCPSNARTFVECANTQFDEDFICDNGQTRLADTLCDGEDERLRACLNDE